MKRVCIVGISGKLGQYMAEHALAKGYEVVGVCRPESVGKLDRFGDRIRIYPGKTNDRDVIREAVKGCDGVLTVLVPWGIQQYSSGTAQAVMDFAKPGARLIFSCGWHISMTGDERMPLKMKLLVHFFGTVARWFRMVELEDQVEAARRIFASDQDWTVVRGSGLEEGESEGLPVWSDRADDPKLASDLCRRTDFALFMVHALEDDGLIRRAPAIVGRNAPSVMAQAA